MRQHGGVATTCIHGFDPGTCLICQTLQVSPKTATKQAAGPDQGGEGRRGRRAAKAAQSLERPAAPMPVRPDAVLPAKKDGGSGLGLRVMGILFLIILAAVAAWFVFGLVIHILHIVELIAVALGAGWLGWKLGVHHGRRTRG
jgi:Flp pilus assembly protein TadB